MNKVEVFKAVEMVEDRESVEFHREMFSRERHQAEYFGGIPSAIEFKIENYRIRTIAQQRAVSRLMPEEHRRREVRQLLEEGFSPREERFSPPDPYITFYEKVKKFVIADKFVDSAFHDAEKHNQETDFSRRACNLLIIDQTNDINKLTYELNSQSEVLDNYREEYCSLENRYSHLKSMNLFQRIFQWKKACNGK